MGECMEMVQLLIALGVGVAVYFIPTIAASNRDHRNVDAIVVFNLFFWMDFLGLGTCVGLGLY